MSNTITFTAKGGDAHYTISELNTLFSQIKTFVDAKLDRRGDTIGGNIFLTNGSIINVPPPENEGDLLTYAGVQTVQAASETEYPFTLAALDGDQAGDGDTTLSWAEPSSQEVDFFDSATPTRITIPSGVSRIQIHVEVSGTGVTENDSTYWGPSVRKNGTTAYVGYSAHTMNVDSSAPRVHMVSPILEVEEGDYFEVDVLSNDGTHTITQAGTNVCVFDKSNVEAALYYLDTDAINPGTGVESFTSNISTAYQDLNFEIDSGVVTAKGTAKVSPMSSIHCSAGYNHDSFMAVNVTNDGDRIVYRGREPGHDMPVVNSGYMGPLLTPTLAEYVLAGTFDDGSQTVSGDGGTWMCLENRSYVPSTFVQTEQDQSGTTAPIVASWEIEVYDELGAYDSGDNTKLTVPAGTDVVIVGAQCRHLNAGGKSWFEIRHYDVDDTDLGIVARDGGEDNFFLTMLCSSLPVAVSEGDYFVVEFTAATDTNYTFDGNDNNQEPLSFWMEKLRGS